jgi:Flp pilus assembly protein TadG
MAHRGAAMLKTMIGIAYGSLAAAMLLLLRGSTTFSGLMLNLMVAGVGIVAAAAALWTSWRRNGLRPVGGLVADERGNVALIFGLGALMLVTVSAFAFDLTRVVTVRSHLQDALDAATLAGARETNTDKMYAAAEDALKAQTGTMKGLANLEVEFKLQGDVLVGNAKANVAPIFLGVPPGQPFKVATHTEVERGINGSLEVALVLDTTFSMTGASGSTDKITTLKVAAKDLVQKITKDPKADVKIAVIPFGQYVNVGVSRRNESYVDVAADYQTGSAQQCTTTYDTSVMEETVCKKYEQKTCTGTKDGTPYTYSCNGSCIQTEVKKYPQGKPKQTCTGGYSNYKFNGCVSSPPYPQNVQDKDASRKYPGLFNTTCGTEMQVLTKNQGQVISTIENLKAEGETYIPSGMAWGFNALSAVKPLTEAAAYDSTGRNMKPRKVIVLMTDGENTKYLQPNSNPKGQHNGNSPASGKPTTQTNDFTLELCTNAKAEKIEIFTIAFQVTNGPAKTLLQQCATDTSHYFDATDSQKLMDAFSSIAESLKSIFISS